MEVRKVDPSNIDPAAIKKAAAIIIRGGLVAFPTETVYGLGADATNPSAVTRIFAAKGRPSYNPLIVHVLDVTGAARCVTKWPDAADALARRFWPGPLTLVLPKAANISDLVTAGLPSVGVRVPNHAIAQALLREAGVPIAAPSANRSMMVSPTQGEHVAASLGDAPDLVLDAGPVSVGIESTVLDLTGEVATILRPGMISVDDLRSVLGRVEVASGHAPDGVARPSPGMMDRHYSPAAHLTIADSHDLSRRAEELRSSGAKVIVLARSPITDPTVTAWQMPETAADYARVLYGTLHRADAEEFSAIVVEKVPDGAAWDGVRDRLRRAAR